MKNVYVNSTEFEVHFIFYIFLIFQSTYLPFFSCRLNKVIGGNPPWRNVSEEKSQS